MRKGLLASLGSLLVGAGLANAQAPYLQPGWGMPAQNAPVMPAVWNGYPGYAMQPMVIPVQAAEQPVPAPAAPMPMTAAPALPDPGSNAFADSGGTGNGTGTGNQASRFWASAEYMAWWVSQSPVPVPLVIGNAFNAPGAATGIRTPGSVVLLGEQPIQLGRQDGGRINFGVSLDDSGSAAVEGSWFFVGKKTLTQSVANNNANSPNLAVPFFNAATAGAAAFSETSTLFAGGTPTVIIILPVPALRGSAVESLSSRIQGAELNGTFSMGSPGGVRLALLAGVRYLDFREVLQFAVESHFTPVGGVGALNFRSTDIFDAQNNFYAAQLGTRVEYATGPVSFNATGKIAIGDMRERVVIDGTGTQGILGGNSQVLLGGFFAQPSNIGRHTDNRLAIMPELDVNVSVRLAAWARLTAGYTIFYVDNVARPGDQIDRNINTTRTAQAAANGVIPVGGVFPSYPNHQTSLLAQAVSLGLEFRY